jgi:hypothetical protein
MTSLLLCVLLSQDPALAPEAWPDAERTEEIDKAFAAETPRRVRVTLTDGRVLVGKLLLRDDLQMLVLTDAGEPVKVDVDQVQRYEEPLMHRDRSRYLFGGSALLPEVGQITVSQIEVFATVFEVGVSEHFSFQLGGALPAYFLGAQGINAFAAVKAGTSFNRVLHVAVELKLLALGYLEKLAGAGSAVPAAGLVALTGTVGTEDFNFSVSVGPPFYLAELSTGGQVMGLPLFTASGFARVHQNVGLVTENWFVPNVNNTERWFIADMLGARFFAFRWAIDVGLLVMPAQVSVSGPVPPVLPWLNFSYHL